MSRTDKQRGIEEAARARAEVYQTLEQLQHKLNFAKRVDEKVDETKMRVAQARAVDPVGFATIVAGIAIVSGLAAWGVATLVARSFR